MVSAAIVRREQDDRCSRRRIDASSVACRATSSNAARTISDAEARFLADRAITQCRTRASAPMDKSGQSSRTLSRRARSIRQPARSCAPSSRMTCCNGCPIRTARSRRRSSVRLEKYVGAHVVGEWLIGVHGIGPVISAGLLAHIDIHKAPTVGHIWRFAGLDPTVKWEKKTKRPWNAQLKVICWKAGESFVKFHNSEECFYGHLWKKQKEVYIARNEAGDYAARAAQILTERKIGKDTDAYKAYSVGRFPPAHVHAMARRWAVKIFLAHLHAEMYRRILKTEPPLPSVLQHLGHAHMIQPAALREPCDPSEPYDGRAPVEPSEPQASRAPSSRSEPSQ